MRASPTSPRTRNKPRWRALAVATVLLFAIVSPAAPNASAHARGHHEHSAASVLSWNQTASDAFLASAYGPPVFATAIAAVQAAVYNAVVGVKGGYEQYKWHKRAHRGTSVDAAVAAAAHDMLVKYAAAAAQPNVEAAYTAALDAIPDGWSKDAGIQFGERAAARILELRAGDGWMDTAIVFTQPAGARGLAAHATGVRAVRRTMGGPDEALPAPRTRPVPALRLRRAWTPPQYAADVLEVQDIGVRVEHHQDGEADRDRAPLRRPGQQLSRAAAVGLPRSPDAALGTASCGLHAISPRRTCRRLTPSSPRGTRSTSTVPGGPSRRSARRTPTATTRPSQIRPGHRSSRPRRIRTT